MSKTSLLDIQTAIYNLLTGDATLGGMITGVFDFPPKGQEMPYIQIGNATEDIFNTFDRQGSDVTETIHIFSEHEGFKEALQILDRLVDLLDYQTITVARHSLVYVRYDNGETALIEIDNGRTRHVAARFRIIVQEV